MPAFLLEVGLEEIPAGMIAAAQTELAQRVEKLLTRERLTTDALRVMSYSTPRRLAVLVDGLLPGQPDMQEEVVGPATRVAFKDGAPTQAAIAFAKKSGVDVSTLKTIQNAKGEYVSATVHRRGRTAVEVLTEGLPAEIAGIYWPKSMYWRAGKPERFVRPVRWMVALLNADVLPLEFAGVAAGRASYGHRVLHGNAPVMVSAPHEYAKTLAAAYVEVDPAARRERIRKALDKATRQISGARWREDEDLVEIVTNLTEWPSVILGGFEASYLDLPEEVLVTVMRGHQKYFALEDSEKKLLPNFLAVLNLEVDVSGAEVIRHGNERVLRARFNDARFFWDVDQKIPLVDRVEMLKSVTFQKDLGSYWDKTERNRAVARRIIDRFDPPLFDSEIKFDTFCAGVDQAALLAKADLTTEMVKEFTELQGVVGGLYARAQRLPDGVARAIHDHYKPASQEDTIPSLPAGSVVALADKMSSIVDMFAIGLQPTGSKDPFALRRAGNGVVRILVEDEKLNDRLHLSHVSNAAIDHTKAAEDAALRSSIDEFLLDRFEFYLRESAKVNPQVARAVRKAGTTGSDDSVGGHLIGYGKIAGFAKALDAQVGSPNVLAVAELLKRTANILRQAREKKIIFTDQESEGLLRETAEKELSRKVTEVNQDIQRSYREGNYDGVIAAIASLQPPLNTFFDSVMVMVEDASLRDNRLALLSRTESVVRWAADFSELASI
ncbi:MAG TPA: glycine--tRNA ligase subunit beta [Acidobacteriaceae bacterium]|nr:glycine--tRNA ligase subunit beta [Acidobacteriaceae bacterium]